MIVRVEQHETQKDIEVLITYPKKNTVVESIVSFIHSLDLQIPCFSDDCIEFIKASKIYYVESIDNKTIIHCDKNNYQVKERLYQMYEKLKEVGFIQINKYCIVNIKKMAKIKSLGNSHLEAVLKNGQCVIVTRKYLVEIKKLLKEMYK
jgi:DNA-binding LytR/AlgR family response regulator